MNSFQNQVWPGNALNAIQYSLLASAQILTGFDHPENVIVTYDSVARKITLTGTFIAYYNGLSVSVLTSGWISPAHPANTTTNQHLYYNGTTFVWSSTYPTFQGNLLIAFAIYDSVSSSFGQRECHGLMDWRSHQDFHMNVGTYKISGGDLSGYVVGSTTAGDRRPLVSSAKLYDEDDPTSIPAITTNSYSVLSLTGSTGTPVFTTASADIIPLSGNQPYYNQFTGGSWIQTLMGNNTYTNAWLLAIPTTTDTGSTLYSYLWVQGQVSDTLAANQALSTSSVNLGTFGANLSEFVFVAKIILHYQAGNWSITQVNPLAGSVRQQVPLLTS